MRRGCSVFATSCARWRPRSRSSGAGPSRSSSSPAFSSVSKRAGPPARARTRRCGRGGGRAGSRARGAARPPPSGIRRRRAGRRSVIARASGWNVWTSTRPGASRPLRPASWVRSWKVRSSARKSGRPSPVSASTTAASATPSKWWPLATICVPTRTARSVAAKRASASAAAPGRLTVSASSRISSSSGNCAASSRSRRCVPAPRRASSGEPHDGQISGAASS